MDERRSEVRQLTCIPAHVDRGDEDSPHLALIADLSLKGARLFTRHKLAVGDGVQLSLYLSAEESPAREARGSVVRCERRPLDRSDIWHWEVGIVFAESIEQYAEEVDALCERQRRIGLLK